MNHVKSKKERRHLVIVGYLGLGFAVVSLLPAYFHQGDINLAFLLICHFTGLATSVYAFASLWTSIKEFSGAKDEDLDERQLIVRNRAYAKAYRRLCSLFIILGFFLTVLPNQMLGNLFELLQTIYWLAVIIMLSLPSMTIAWNEPDPEPVSESLNEREKEAPR